MEAERPIECSGCKKEASICYRQVEKDRVETTKYCPDCPLLKERTVLIGDQGEAPPSTIEKSVICPQCKTTLHSVMTGGPFGCSQCYETFETFLMQELIQEGALPLAQDSILRSQKKMSLHLGNVPSQSETPDYATKLRSLNTALHEALAIENYERAAHLRDQIKNLMTTQSQKNI